MAVLFSQGRDGCNPEGEEKKKSSRFPICSWKLINRQAATAAAFVNMNHVLVWHWVKFIVMELEMFYWTEF